MINSRDNLTDCRFRTY